MPKTVLKDFYATWCQPCKMIAPIIEEIKKEKPDLVVEKIDVDAKPELANQYGVMSIPTLIVEKDGKEVNRITGAVAKSKILAIL